MGLLGLGEAVAHFFDGQAFWMVSASRYWIFPLQTVICGALLIRYWRYYAPLSPVRPCFTLTLAAFVFAIWISPQALFHAVPRTDGFDPAFFGNGWACWLNAATRWVRLIIVVPLLEEVFWRGFLLRFLIREPFEKVPFGTFTWTSCAWVTFFFAGAHWGPDFWPALLTGALYNLVAYRTRSLGSCVLAHATTNLLLGIYIFATGQWGFW